MSEHPVDDVLDARLPAAGPTGADPERAHDGGWERARAVRDGFEDHLLGEKPQD